MIFSTKRSEIEVLWCVGPIDQHSWGECTDALEIASDCIVIFPESMFESGQLVSEKTTEIGACSCE